MLVYTNTMATPWQLGMANNCTVTIADEPQVVGGTNAVK